MALSKNKLKMELLKNECGTGVIPDGIYCYDDRVCPYLDYDDSREDQDNGYCWYMNKGDWDIGLGLLWDSCKECGVKTDWKEDDEK